MITCPIDRKILRKEEKFLLEGILALEESICKIREHMEIFDSRKDLNVCTVRLNYESILKSKEYSLCVMKAQRCVVVHVLNGHEAKAEKWLQKFVERVNDVGESMHDRIPHALQERETCGT